jgi:predicted PurR-regulated permease PerM
MTRWEQVPPVSLGLLATLAAIGALYVGREFFVPIALALLLNALLRPLVRGLERLRVPTVAGATLVVLGLVGGLTAGGLALAGPVRAWVSQLPASLETTARKLEPARHSLEHVSQAAQAVTDPGGAPPAAPAPPAVPPFLTQLFGTTATFVAGLAEVLLLLYLSLAAGDLFLRKVVEVLPLPGDKRTAVRVTEEVQEAVTRYMGATLLINLGQGTAVGLTLWGLGLPHPWLWGG